jgi:hypothetical protein
MKSPDRVVFPCVCRATADRLLLLLLLLLERPVSGARLLGTFHHQKEAVCSRVGVA